MQDQFDLSLALAVARRRALIVLACLVAGLAGAYAVTQRMPREYRATATLFVGAGALQGDQANATVAQGLATSYAQLAETRTIAQGAAREAGLPPGAVIGHISSSASPGVQILELTGDADAPATAVRIADAAAAVLVARVGALTQPRTNQVSVQLVDAATSPSGPVSPRTSLNLLLGGLVGLVIGVALALGRERLDRRLRTRADAERELDVPLLGLTPKLSRRSRRADALTRHADPRIAEPYRSIAATLVSVARAAGHRRILISSASSDDGKTTLAAHLALALAEDHQPTALIEADLHRPSLSRHFPSGDATTLSEIVSGVNRAVPDSATVCTDLKVVRGANGENLDDLDVRDDEFQHMLEAALSEHTTVLLDGPPVLGGSDARILARSADAVLLVASAGTSRTDDVRLAIATFRRLGLDVAGLVLTSAKTHPTGRNTGLYG